MTAGLQVARTWTADKTCAVQSLGNAESTHPSSGRLVEWGGFDRDAAEEGGGRDRPVSDHRVREKMAHLVRRGVDVGIYYVIRDLLGFGRSRLASVSIADAGPSQIADLKSSVASPGPLPRPHVTSCAARCLRLQSVNLERRLSTNIG